MSADRLSGHVVAFDAAVGLGTVRGADGSEYLFHCVEIADGTRDIAVGAPVTFVPTPKRGRIEAFSVTPNESPV